MKSLGLAFCWNWTYQSVPRATTTTTIYTHCAWHNGLTKLLFIHTVHGTIGLMKLFIHIAHGTIGLTKLFIHTAHGTIGQIGRAHV